MWSFMYIVGKHCSEGVQCSFQLDYIGLDMSHDSMMILGILHFGKYTTGTLTQNNEI